jgi:crotonobetainyl-CoA:carnitine CoA-transferase CaiB-like acyl-CoA transferase
MRQFLDHPQLEARDRWREVDSPVGRLRALLPPATLEGTEPLMSPIPQVGEHNAALLAELGYENVDVGAPLRDGGPRQEIPNDESYSRPTESTRATIRRSLL